jgi:hypothetical protein
MLNVFFVFAFPTSLNGAQSNICNVLAHSLSFDEPANAKVIPDSSSITWDILIKADTTRTLYFGQPTQSIIRKHNFSAR